MVAGIHSERMTSCPLASIHTWLVRNRAAGPRLGAFRLRVGLPITAPSAVICSVDLMGLPLDAPPLVAGRLQGVLDPRTGSVRLAFDGSASPDLTASDPGASREGVRAAGIRAARDLIGHIARECGLGETLATA